MKRPVFFAVVVLLFASLACSFGGNLLPNGQGGNSNSNVLFRDDFSNTSSGWDSRNDADGITDYYNNSYRIMVNKTQFDFWANPGLTTLPSDVSTEVDATKNGGPDNNDFGILCRYQDTSNFYELLASSDGYVGIVLVKDGNPTTISSSDHNLQPSDTVKQGTATNHLRADCVGDALTLYVNGQKAASAQDSSFSNGDVGLIAGTFDTAGADILFDNFVVSKPYK